MNKQPTVRACNLVDDSDICFNFKKPQYFLYILVNNKCQAKCKFCTQANNSDVDFNVDKLKSTLNMLNEHTKKTGTVISKVNFTGGEPLIDFEKFRTIFNVTDDILNLSELNVILNTNGYNIDKLYDADDIMTKVSHVSFSRHHYDDTINSEIFGTNKVPSTEDLKKFISKFKDSVWIRCNEIKGYIDSEDEVEKYCEWCVKTGCNHCGFSTLMQLNEYCKDNFVDIKIPTSNKFNSLIDHFKYDCNNKLVCNCFTTIYEDENGWCDIVSWNKDVESNSSDGILVFDGEYLRDNFFGNILY